MIVNKVVRSPNVATAVVEFLPIVGSPSQRPGTRSAHERRESYSHTPQLGVRCLCTQNRPAIWLMVRDHPKPASTLIRSSGSADDLCCPGPRLRRVARHIGRNHRQQQPYQSHPPLECCYDGVTLRRRSQGFRPCRGGVPAFSGRTTPVCRVIRLQTRQSHHLSVGDCFGRVYLGGAHIQRRRRSSPRTRQLERRTALRPLPNWSPVQPKTLAVARDAPV